MAQVLVLDAFLQNPDRGLQNFLLVRHGTMQQICVIDFAKADLDALTSLSFPVANSTTAAVGREMRAVHGDCRDSALEMVDRIGATPKDAFMRFVGETPEEWLTQEQRGRLDEAWSSSGFCERLDALRARLKDGTLV